MRNGILKALRAFWASVSHSTAIFTAFPCESLAVDSDGALSSVCPYEEQAAVTSSRHLKQGMQFLR